MAEEEARAAAEKEEAAQLASDSQAAQPAWRPGSDSPSSALTEEQLTELMEVFSVFDQVHTYTWLRCP